MKKLAARLLVVIVLTGGLATAAPAQPPSYLILQAPTPRPKSPPYYPGRGYAVRTHAYAYGWFGVQPRHHLRRSTGYHGRYIQWAKQ